MSTDDLASPPRPFLAQLEDLRSADVLDMDQVGRLLVELAADEEYLGPLIAELPAKSPGGRWLVKPERGPRLVLFHRPEGMMATPTPTSAGSRSRRSAESRPISAGTPFPIKTAGLNCASSMTAPCTVATWRR
jgi:hypothetical protein